MNGWQIALLSIYGSGLLLTVGKIGKPRKPVTPAEAVVTLVVTAVMAYLVVRA